MARQNFQCFYEILTDGNTLEAILYELFPAPYQNSYVSQHYYTNPMNVQMSSVTSDRSFPNESLYTRPEIQKTFSFFKNQFPLQNNLGGFAYPIYYAAFPETNDLIPHTIAQLSGMVHHYEPMVNYPTMVHRYEPMVNDSTMVQTYEPMVNDPTMVHPYEPMVNDLTMVHPYEPMVNDPTMVHRYQPMVNDPTMVHRYGPMVNNPTMVHPYEPIINDPTMVHRYEPMVNDPTMVHHYEPMVNNPTMVHQYDPFAENPTMVHHYEPMVNNPTMVHQYDLFADNPTMVHHYEPMVNNPNMYGGWGQMEMIDQERRSHETYDPFLCPTCDEVFLTPFHYESHLRSYCEARKRFEGIKRQEVAFDKAVGKRPMGSDNERIVGKNPVGCGFERAVGKKPFP